MSNPNITIIGAGSGGYATAFDLIQRGFKVGIFELDDFQANLFPMIETGRIKATGELAGIVSIPTIFNSMEAAVREADIILVTTHAASHQQIAHQLAAFVRDQQVIVLVPGYTGGALIFHKIFKENGVNKEYIVAETNTLPYACRNITGESAVHIKLNIKSLMVSCFPAIYNDQFLKVFKRLYPQSVLVNNVLETGFNNGNPVLNVAPSIFNAGRIEFAKGDYYHFQEGVSPSVAEVMSLIDVERMQISQAMGLETISYLERVMKTGYVRMNENWYEMISTSPHLTAQGPDNLRHRYITEDVPYGLTPWFHFASERGVQVPLMQSLITLASALLGVDYFKAGRHPQDMGIEGLDNEELKHFLRYGREN